MQYHDCNGKASKKVTPKEDVAMKLHTQAGSITTNIKLRIDFTWTELSAAEILMWNFHVDDSSKGRYEMILGRDLLTALGLNLKWYDHFIEAYYGFKKGQRHPWLIWVRMNLKIEIQGWLHLNNHLRMLTHKKYKNRNKSVLLLNDYT